MITRILAKVLFFIVVFQVIRFDMYGQERVIPLKSDTTVIANPADTVKQAQVLQKSVSISELSNEELSKQGGGSQGLKAIPGLSVVSSSDGPANIRVRGLPGGGYRYVGYMEDGLPVLPTGYYSVPSSDQYFKSDLTVKTVEGTRGGNAPILLSNTPGALINYISKTGADVPYGHFKYTAGLSQQSHRADANMGGKLGSLWQYNAGGFYRTDKGVVPANYISNLGGQFKLNITRQFLDNKGFIRFYGKYLDDKVANAQKGIYAYNNEHIAKATSGFDVFTQTLLPQEYTFHFNLPEGNAYTSDMSKQYHNQLAYGGLLVNVNLRSWTLNNRLRYQNANSRIVTDAITGIFAADNMSLVRLDGSPFNQSNGYYVNHSIKDITRSDQQLIDNLTFKRNIGKHVIEIGAGVYLYNMDSENVNFSFKSELANQPHVLTRANSDVISMASLYDPSGHNKYEGLTTTSSLYINSDLILSDHVSMNVSARFDNQDITGKKARFEGSSVRDGGTGFIIAGKNKFSDNRNYWSASVGVTYTGIKNLSVFGRATRAYNAINIDDLGSVDVNPENLKNRTVYSLELGDRYNYGRVRFSQSLSYTTIDNLLLVVNIPNSGGSLVSQSTFASSRTYSFEMEFAWLMPGNINLQLTSTLQNVKFTQYKFTVKNTAAPEYSGKEVDWKGNIPGSMPSVILQYSLNYAFKNIDVYAKANTTGKIYTTDAETYTLPAYTEVSAGVGYRFLKKYSLRVWANNLFNNRRLMDGNTMGEQFINVNNLVVGQPMIGRAILPRSLWLSLEYKF